MRQIRYPTRTVVLFLGLIWAASTLVDRDERHDPRGSEVETAVSLASSDRALALYHDWRVTHESRGGDRNVHIRLGFFKGLSKTYTEATGVARLNLLSGTVGVQVSGLRPEIASDVWLVDNVEGDSRSVRPEPGDRWLELGALRFDGPSATLRVELPPDVFDRFRVDSVVVTERGEDPSSGAVLFGSPPLFQRIYTEARLAADAPTRSRAAEFSWLGTPVAHAASIAVDADVLLDALVAEGAQLFIEETFEGNGRTCATCHPAVNNFTIDPNFIARLPDSDPLFVAELVPALAENFENPLLMRTKGLILENLDGFEDLANKFTMRSVPHTLALATSIEGPPIPFDNTANPDFNITPPAQRTGWSSDGAPGAGTLREFATGAVIQHFPLRTDREPGVDFRLPTDAELDAMEAFQLALGRSEELNLSDPSSTDFLTFVSPVVERGKEIFNTLDSDGGRAVAGKCALCHNNAGASLNGDFFSILIPGVTGGNANFGTGVNELPSLPADVIDGDNNPRDGGFARVAHDGTNCVPARGGFGTVTPDGGALPPGLCEEDFNTPPLVEAADTAPFFHNNAVDTLEAAVSFYNDPAFNDSPGGQLLTILDSGAVGIELSSTDVTAVANMLRVVNALENIRSSSELARAAIGQSRSTAHRLLDVSIAELKDAIEVLGDASLHPEAVQILEDVLAREESAKQAPFRFLRDIRVFQAQPIKALVRPLLVQESS